jgi:hypothetical protein
MTLKEKFNGLVPKEFGGMQEPLLTDCEKIADDYAIEFAEWLGVNNYKKYSNGWANMFTKATLEKELLEIFKKEKGL